MLVDLENPWMMPVRDPLRSLVFHAADRAVKDVFIAGKKVVADGKVLTIDRADAAARLTQAQARMMARTPGWITCTALPMKSPRSAFRSDEFVICAPLTAEGSRPSGTC